MTETENRLVKAYKKYIEFLTDSYSEVFDIATIHGYRCSEEDIKLGETLRNNIYNLEQESHKN